MKVKCYSVRLKSLTPLSAKAYLAEAFDGSSDVIPASQIFGQDFDVSKSDAYWISEWILQKKELQYSSKKIGWFDSESRKMLPTYTVERHTPEHKDAVASNEIKNLRSE